jgi:hypothetical protein
MGHIGIADIPDWLNFEEQPPRSFKVKWIYPEVFISRTSTKHTTSITKEVSDIIMSLNNV